MVVIFTTCSGCRENVILSIRPSLNGTATVNGQSNDVFYEDGEFSIIMWDCPSCGYADSYDRTYRA